MNANSRKILERKLRMTETGENPSSGQGIGSKVVDGKIVKVEVTRATKASTRKTAKSVPTEKLDLRAGNTE